MELAVISQQEAKAKGLPRFFTGVPCVRGHLVERFVSSKACVVCARANQNKWDSANKDKLRQYTTKYDQANRDQRREAARLYRQQNPEAANKATQQYRRRNKSLVSALCSERRASLLKATPAWVNRSALKLIYAECENRSRETGTPYQVDHIVPLKNKYVCGLHVPCNLQILTATENRRKRNQFEIDHG